MLWLEVKNLHAEIDGAAARALWRHGSLPRVAVYNTKEGRYAGPVHVKAREFFG
jgi:hypothetical protein